MKLSILFALGLLAALPFHVFAQSLPVGKYSDAALTDGYKRGLITNLLGSAKNENGETVTVSAHYQSSPSTMSKFKGNRFLKVEESGVMFLSNFEQRSKSISYVDPSTLREKYSVDLLDDEITSIEYLMEYPERMNVGDKVLLKKDVTVSKKNPNKVTSRSLGFLSLQSLEGKEGLYEFCESFQIYKPDTGFQKVDGAGSSCVVLNKDGEKVGYFMEIAAEGAQMHLTGMLEVK